jgi:hypothetical protein
MAHVWVIAAVNRLAEHKVDRLYDHGDPFGLLSSRTTSSYHRLALSQALLDSAGDPCSS